VCYYWTTLKKEEKSMSQSIKVVWETQDEVVPGAENINHFGIKLTDTAGAVIDDASEPLDARSHMFVNVAPGDYFVIAQSYNADESVPSSAPMTAPVSVVAEATAPVIVSLTPSVAPNVVTPLK
jgi:hypothetical protein